VVSLVLALPSPVSVSPRRLEPSVCYAALAPVPLPSRWVVLAMAALVHWRRWDCRRPWPGSRRTACAGAVSPVIPVLLVGAMVVSFLELGENPTTTPLQCESPAAGVRGARSHTLGNVVDYPFYQDINRLFWQRKFVGRCSIRSIRHGRRRRTEVLTNPRTPGTAEQLALLGVTAIVTHRDALRYSSRFRTFRTPIGSRLCTRRAYARRLFHMAVTASGHGSVTLPGFSGPNPLADAALGFPLSSPSGVAYIGFRSKQAQLVRLSRRDAAKDAHAC